MAADGVTRRVTFRDVLRDGEFRALYVAQGLSSIGDQLARIAVAVLVFHRSHSPLLTAASFGISYLPWAVGGPLLSAAAERMRRRNVMIFCDLVRAVVVTAMAVPRLPVAAILVLVALVATLEPPFTTSRASLLPDVLGEGERYAIASTLSNTTNSLGGVVGFAAGGAAVAAMGVRATLLLDTMSFLVSAALLASRVVDRPAVRRASHPLLQELREGARTVFEDAQLRWLVLVSWLVVGVAIAAESVAVPYAAAHGGGPAAAGALTAALPVGGVVGALLLGRVVHPGRAPRFMLPMALATPALLAVTAFDPPPLLVGVIWFLAGVASSMQIIANRMFVVAVPREVRGRAFGIAVAGLATAQGVCAVVCGLLADHLGPARAVADVALPVCAGIVILSVGSVPSSLGVVRTTTTSEPEQDDEGAQPVDRAPAARPERTVWAFIGSLVVVAAVGMLFVPRTAAEAPGLPTWWLFALFTIALAAPLHIVFRRQPWALHLEAVPLVLGLFFLSPLQLVGARVGATVLTRGIIRRQPLIRVTFNVASTAVATLCVVATFRAALPAGTGLVAATWPAAFVGVVTDDVVSTALVSVVIYITERVWQYRELPRVLGTTLTVNVISTFLALVTATALYADRATAWAITVFVALSIGAFRTYHRLADRHAALDRLYAVARELGPMAADPADLAPALAQLRRIIRADTLELALPSSADGFATVVRVTAGNTGDAIEVDEQTADEGQLVAPAQPSRLERLTTRRRTAAPDHIAVAVGSGDSPSAVLTARNRSGDIGNFDQTDYRLLEAAAGQLSAALEKGRLVEGLRRAATRDSLTDLANLDSLREFLTTMLDGSTGGILLLLDVDRFHEINDTLGHDAGDIILVEVARRLERAPSHGSLVARVGGDQFALAIPGQAGAEVARLAALAVKSRVDGPLRIEALSADLRVTVGVARSPDHGSDAATLLRRAEIAMASAKGTATAIAEWEPGFERDGSRRLQVLAGLRDALAHGDLTVDFQPKIALGSGEVAGFEALVRWRDRELGPVSPAEFVPLAEASGLISALTSTVLRTALDTVRQWHDLDRRVGVAVNISARSLDDPVLVGQVAAMLTASRVNPRWLTLEITESSVMENVTRSVDVLLQLRSLGVRLSIDDFGTGYSSLHQLRGLPVHEVKIDKAFVDHVDGDGADRAVVRAIVELCDSLGLTTVAEGVEQASQAYVLSQLGVGQVQGYFYGRPMSRDAATEWLLGRTQAENSERG